MTIAVNQRIAPSCFSQHADANSTPVNRTEKLKARQQPVNQRVAELTVQLSREETQLRQLTERLKAETGK